MKQVLVTGATGLVGSYAVEALLKSGFSVRATVRESSQAKAEALPFYKEVEWVIGSLHDTVFLDTILEGIDTVVHCAAFISFQKGKAKELFYQNVKATAQLVNCCLAKEEKPYFVLISSISAITGERNQTDPLTGTSTTMPDALTSTYGLSKYLQELEVWRGIEEGLQATILSPGFILGARKDAQWETGSASIFRYVYQRKPFYTKGTMNYVDVEDVSIAIVSAVTHQTGGRHVIVGGTCTYQEFFNKVAASMGVPAPSHHLSPWVSNFLAKAISIVGFFLPLPEVASPDALRSSQRKTVCSGEEAAVALGISYHPLENTIEGIVTILRKQGLVA